MFARRSENRSMPEVPHTRRPVFRAQFWSAGEVADVSQKNVGVNEPGSLTCVMCHVQRNYLCSVIAKRIALASVHTYRTVPEKRTGSCGMIDSFDRSRSSPTCDISILSISIRPPDSSVSRNSAAIREDFPAQIKYNHLSCFKNNFLSSFAWYNTGKTISLQYTFTTNAITIVLRILIHLTIILTTRLSCWRFHNFYCRLRNVNFRATRWRCWEHAITDMW